VAVSVLRQVVACIQHVADYADILRGVSGDVVARKDHPRGVGAGRAIAAVVVFFAEGYKVAADLEAEGLFMGFAFAEAVILQCQNIEIASFIRNACVQLYRIVSRSEERPVRKALMSRLPHS